ncbi:MAG: hypothetical protein ABJ013_07770 [Halioglobus sp.]
MTPQTNKCSIPTLFWLALAAMFTATPDALSDSVRSRCGYSERADAEPETYQPCVFSQRQGYINISIGSNTPHLFSPDGDSAGTYLDQEGQRVYRKKGLDGRGQIFQLSGQYLYVLWNPAPSRLECQDTNLTAPSQCLLGDGNVGFALQATSGSSLNTLTLSGIGLSIDNEAQKVELDGNAYLAELADLDSDGWPEVYVYVSSAGSGSYGSLVAYAVNNGKSATPIYLPPIDTNVEASSGYQGHDEFRVVENRLERRYPIYAEGDTNASPSGGMRQIQYRLLPGEAGWKLEIENILEY